MLKAIDVNARGRQVAAHLTIAVRGPNKRVLLAKPTSRWDRGIPVSIAGYGRRLAQAAEMWQPW